MLSQAQKKHCLPRHTPKVLPNATRCRIAFLEYSMSTLCLVSMGFCTCVVISTADLEERDCHLSLASRMHQMDSRVWEDGETQSVSARGAAGAERATVKTTGHQVSEEQRVQMCSRNMGWEGMLWAGL